jgi:hypothetical protein
VEADDVVDAVLSPAKDQVIVVFTAEDRRQDQGAAVTVPGAVAEEDWSRPPGPK